jgi:predicted nicotinamide N-methyase
VVEQTHIDGKSVQCTRDVDETSRIAGYPVVRTRVSLPGGDVALYTVRDLEHLVDRDALLRGEEEPPYWAHLWTGAVILARHVAKWLDVAGRRVVDLGCGLGLAGLAAARGGADVLFVDHAPPATTFALASARANGFTRAQALCADFRTLGSRLHVDLVLAAEVAYDPTSFAALAEVFEELLTPHGSALVADAYRIDTRPFYRALATRGLVGHAIDLTVAEEGRPLSVRLTQINRLARA